MSLDLKIHLLEALQNPEMAKASGLKAAFGNECESCACLGKRLSGGLCIDVANRVPVGIVLQVTALRAVHYK